MRYVSFPHMYTETEKDSSMALFSMGVNYSIIHICSKCFVSSSHACNGSKRGYRLTPISLGVPPSSYKGWDTERTVPLISLARKDVKYFPQRTHRSASVSRARHLFMVSCAIKNIVFFYLTVANKLSKANQIQSQRNNCR